MNGSQSSRMVVPSVCRTGRSARGASFIESMCLLGLICTLAGMAVSSLAEAIDAARGFGAARHLAAQARLIRMEAATQSRTIAIRFEAVDDGYRYGVYADGNDNGVRSSDIARGIDLPLAPVTRIEDRFPGVRVELGPNVPPVGSESGAGGSPLRLGSGNLLSFAPSGSSTSGTIYLRSWRGRQYAVRVLGATGRVRVLQYSVADGEWIEH